MTTSTAPAFPLFAVADLAVRAGDVELLANVSMRLERGDLVGVVGPSGSGKTTLLRTLAGLSGDGDGVTLAGRGPAECGWPQFRRRVILVDQRPVLFDATVGANLARPFSYRATDFAFEPDRARRLLGLFDLESVSLDADAHKLSVGQQQRVALARALLLEPDVLLLDEPTSALDADNVRRVEELISAQARRGLAALIVTHSLEQARRWCRQVIDLRRFAVRRARAAGSEGGSRGSAEAGGAGASSISGNAPGEDGP
jgi:putative ABC transport system ATP-binding protein